ncbi:MAG: N-acetylmuramic acid 6-phosphate etherase [Faecalibacterium sp.]
MDQYLATLGTEGVNTETTNLDSVTTLEMVDMINRQDAQVAQAVAAQREQIAAAIDLIAPRLENGGRLIYIGAGTSGRLGVLDASECLPTFGVDPTLIQGFIAGGDTALRLAVEGAEDSEPEGIALIDDLALGAQDVLVGISASGSAPYVLAGLRRAKERGAIAIGLCTNAGSKMLPICDITIAPVVGAEVLSGSTRMKSGTAQKLVLNMLSTCSMVKLGKVYGNLMVDLKASNIKLQDRARRLVMHATTATPEEAAAALTQAEGQVKLAILLIETGLTPAKATALLAACQGRLRTAIDSYYTLKQES